MLRRFLVLGVGLAALLWTSAPSHLQAQHGFPATDALGRRLIIPSLSGCDRFPVRTLD
jgi:hypothetical protein